MIIVFSLPDQICSSN